MTEINIDDTPENTSYILQLLERFKNNQPVSIGDGKVYLIDSMRILDNPGYISKVEIQLSEITVIGMDKYHDQST